MVPITPTAFIAARIIAAIAVPLIPVAMAWIFRRHIFTVTNRFLRSQLWFGFIGAFTTGFFFTLNAPYHVMPGVTGAFLALWGVLFASITVFASIMYQTFITPLGPDEQRL